VEEATAEPGSHSRGRATGGAVGIPGVVELHGGVATSETRLDPGKQARTMVATVDSGTIDLVAGLVRLEGLQWRLEQVAVGPDSRTTKVTTSSTFTFGSISLAGVPLPAATADQAASSTATVNAALQPLGIEIRLPELRKYGATGQQLTPLTVAVGGGGTAWGPVLYPLIAGSDATSVVNLFNSLTEPTIFEPVKCESLFGLLKANPEANRIVNTLGLLTPVVLSAVGAALNGGAEVDVEIGGARTSYDDTYYPPRTVTAPTRPAPVGAAPAGRQPARLPALPPEVAVGTAVRTSVSCATSSPVGSPGCSKGAAALAAGLAGALTVGLLATDELWRRRRLRSAPPTTQEVVS
jgi:hypothetical protein